MKRKLMAIALVLVAVFPGFVSANPPTDEERRLVSLAEEISTSEMDDDDKIARLTEVEVRISRLRKNRTDDQSIEISSAPSNPTGERETPQRPISTFVENQVRHAVENETEKDEPSSFSRFCIAVAQYAGMVVVWVLVAAFALYSVAWGFSLIERTKPVQTRAVTNQKSAVPRDGMVPPHLR